MNRITVDPILGRGVSSAETRKLACDHIAELKPARLFDLGCGIGVYGASLKILYACADMHLTGLDGFLPYLMQSTARDHYQTLIWGKIEEVLDGSIRVKADLTICMDVVEHFEREMAEKILRLPGKMLVSTPLFDLKQPAVGGNPLEEHRCWFRERDIVALGFRTLATTHYKQDDGQEGYIGLFERRR